VGGQPGGERAEAIAAVEALREAVIGDLLRPEQHGLAAVQ
jgi:hypothetical protein